jgi:DNA-binding MurR/RpiR family transcriptional regulator
VGNLENPIEKIRAAYPHLSNTQKKIATFMLEESEKACFMVLNEISEKVEVAPVTIIKFVKILGYSNFSEFKKKYQGYFQGMIAPRTVVRKDAPELRDGVAGMTKRIMDNELRLLSSSYEMLNEELLLESIRYIKDARKIFLVAKGLSLPLAELLQIRLTFLSLDSEILKLDNNVLLPRSLIRASDQDLFIIFTFPNYSQILAEIARCAKLRGSRIITITDKTTSPPACYSNLLLFCHVESTIFYNSMTAPVSIINTLAEMLAIEMREKLEENGTIYKTMTMFLEHESS